MDELHEWVEEIGLYFGNVGLSRMPGRILGWLLVCDPPHQSAEELATALRVSSGSISMGVQMLIRAGAVERHTVPGSRRTYYRLRPGFWLREAEEKAKQAREWVKLADRGLELLSDDQDRAQRLREARDMYAFLEAEYVRIDAAWRERQAAKDAKPRKPRRK